MERVTLLLPAGVMTAGTRGASPEKQNAATLQNEANIIADDQAQYTTVKRARGNV